VERHFDEELKQLKERLLTMASHCEKMIHLSVKALEERDLEPANEVFALEREVNQLHLEMDDRAMKLFALQSPVAGDLRAIMAAMKINSELERIGDQAVNVSQNTFQLLKQPQLKPLIDIPLMAEITESMLRDALDAFVRLDTELARQVCLRDDKVDALKDQIFRELLTYMITEPSTIKRCIDLILISRNFERIGDHATNIAEDVIFMVKGQDVRHRVSEGDAQGMGESFH
jgi:phosphate transport system protein